GRIQNPTGTATLTNLTVTSGNVQGTGNVGGLMGYTNATGLVGTNLYANVSVSGAGEDIGGLIGEARGNYTNVGASGLVNQNAANNYVGGLIGRLLDSTSSV